jgi:hypothetical protein
MMVSTGACRNCGIIVILGVNRFFRIPKGKVEESGGTRKSSLRLFKFS